MSILAGLAKLYIAARATKSALGDIAAELETKRVALGDGKSAATMKLTVHSVRTLEERMRYVKQMARKGMVDPKFRRWVASVLNRKCGKEWCVPERDWRGEVVAIFNAFQARFRYGRDIDGIDTFQAPGRTLELGGGDCLPEGTLLVRAPDYAFIPIEEIRAGDRILGDDGWTEVVTTWDKGVLPVLAFELNNGCVLRCTADHRVFRVARIRNRGDTGWATGTRESQEEIRAGDLRPGDDLLQPERVPFGREAIGADRAYILGAYISEGWLEESSASISGIDLDDPRGGKGIKEKVGECCKRLGLRYSPHDRYADIYGKDVVAWLAPCGKGAINKRFPTLDLDEVSIRAAVESVNADGGYAKHGTFVFSTTSPTLALQYRIVQRMLGNSVHIRRVDEHGGLGSNPIYRVTVRAPTGEYTAGERRGTKIWARVRSISDGGEHRVYDLQTKSGRIYLPESDVVVHNCDDAATSLAAALKAAGYPVKFRVIRTTGSRDWDHIFVLVGLPPGKPSEWMALDASVRRPAGWHPPRDRIAATRDFDF